MFDYLYDVFVSLCLQVCAVEYGVLVRVFNVAEDTYVLVSLRCVSYVYDGSTKWCLIACRMGGPYNLVWEDMFLLIDWRWEYSFPGSYRYFAMGFDQHTSVDGKGVYVCAKRGVSSLRNF